MSESSSARVSVNERELYEQILADNCQYIEDKLSGKSYRNYIFSDKFHEGKQILWNCPPLISVCAYCKAIKCLQKLISNDADTSILDKNKMTLQMFAVASRSTEVITLLSTKLNFNFALHYAAQCGYPEIVEFLLGTIKVDSSRLNDEGMTPLHCAAIGGNAECCNIIISYAPQLINDKDNKGNTAVMLATKRGNIQIIKALLSVDDVDVNPINEAGETLLHLAAQVYNTDVIQLIFGVAGKKKLIEDKQWDFFTLDCYAVGNNLDLDDLNMKDEPQEKTEEKSDKISFNVDIKTQSGDTPLMYACASGSLQCFNLLVQKGASLYEMNEKLQTILHLSVLSKDLEMVKNVCKYNVVDVNRQDVDGNTALLIALKQNSPQICQYLISISNLDPNIPDKELDAPIHVCARLGLTSIAECLIKNEKTDLNAVNNKNCTALFLATKGGFPDVALLLLQQSKVNEKIADNEGSTPLHAAARFNQPTIAKELLVESRDVDVNARDVDGWTPLHYASRNAHLEIVEMIVKSSKADVNAQDKRGKTPLYFAMNQDVRKVLMEHGAFSDQN